MASSSSTKLRAFLLIVIILAGAMIAVIVIMQPPADGSPSIRVMNHNDSTVNVTLNEMKSMDLIEGSSSFQNSFGNVVGTGVYVGVSVADLLEGAGIFVTELQVVVVNASDGYSQIFTYDNVYPDTEMYALQGDMVIAFSYNSTEVPEWEDGFRLVFMPADGYFSNSDGEATIDAQFYSGAAGPKCVKNVASIQIIDRPEAPTEPLILDVIVEETKTSYTMSQIQNLAPITGEGGTKNRFGTLDGPFNFTGVSIHALLTSLTSLPDKYNVTIAASDGYTREFNHTLVEGSIEGYDASTGNSVGIITSTMIMAYERDGEPLTDDGPLRVAFVNDNGYLTSSQLWIRNAVNITLILPSPPVLIVKSDTQSIGLTMDDVQSLTPILGSGGYKKRTGTIVPHELYTGVKLIEILSLFGELPTNYTLEVISSDGYKTLLNKTHVEGHLPAYNATTGNPVGYAQFDVVLAYERNSGPLQDDETPFRIAALNDSYLSDGFIWARMVVNLTLIDEGSSFSNLNCGTAIEWRNGLASGLFYHEKLLPHLFAIIEEMTLSSGDEKGELDI